MTDDRRIPTGEEFDRAVTRPTESKGLLRFFKRGKRFQIKQGVGESKTVLTTKSRPTVGAGIPKEQAPAQLNESARSAGLDQRSSTPPPPQAPSPPVETNSLQRKPRPIKISSELRAQRGNASCDPGKESPRPPDWVPSWEPGMTMEELRKKIGPTQNYLDGN